jgi:hypothetical protein
MVPPICQKDFSGYGKSNSFPVPKYRPLRFAGCISLSRYSSSTFGLFLSPGFIQLDQFLRQSSPGKEFGLF